MQLVALSIGGGALMAAAFPPFGWALVVPIALQPVLSACRLLDTKRAGLCAYLFSVVTILAVCHWLYAGAVGIMGAPYYGIAILSALIKAIPFGIAGMFSQLVYRRAKPLWCVGTTAFFVLAEWLQVGGNQGFPFATLSLSQIGTALASVTVPLFGAFGLTAYVVATACCWNSWCARKNIAPLFIALCLTVPIARGSFMPRAHPMPANKTRVVAVAQGRGFVELSKVTLKAIHSPVALVIWPEDSMFVHNASEMNASVTALRRLAASLHTTILAGVAGFDGRELANRALIVHARGRVSVYLKQRLVPFAEYVADRTLFENFFPILHSLGDMKRGERPGDFSVRKGSLLVRPLICYEGTFADMLQGMLPGELAAVITDDSWFRDPSGPRQQLDALRMRAMELGTSMVVSGTTGPSGVIDGNGRWQRAMPLNAVGASIVALQRDHRTWFSRYGDWSVFGAIVLWFCAQMGWMARIRRKVWCDRWGERWPRETGLTVKWSLWHPWPSLSSPHGRDTRTGRRS